ncbi:MAG: heterodisulfide reductase-related iron-sulfur binding cluster, partial [Sporomusa sp.]
SCGCGGMWTECCGKPLVQLGLQSRADAMHERLRAFLQQNKVNKVITACPGCYYELKNIFMPCDVNVQTVYETLDFGPRATTDKRSCTIHDACPDRYHGEFGRQVRQALLQVGFSLREMKHSQQHTICCGSGGQISHFRPDLTEKLVNMRLDEAEELGVDILAAYCLSCVLKFAGASCKIPVTHVLNLLLEQSEDFKEAKQLAKRMLTGPEGEKVWEIIMTDDIDKRRPAL